MKHTRIIMGMPVTVEIVGRSVRVKDLEQVFDYFRAVDERFSPYKETSELTQVNNGLPKAEWSDEMREVMRLCEQTKRQTLGYFDIRYKGKLDPSGLVKGWALHAASKQLLARGFTDFYVEAGGDVQVHGRHKPDEPWSIGIRNPFNTEEIVKVVQVQDQGIATSGTYIRGQHIYDPHDAAADLSGVRSLTVIGPDIYEADRFATAAFAMGPAGIRFIEQLPGFEAYMIDGEQIATYTGGFEQYVAATA